MAKSQNTTGNMLPPYVAAEGLKISNSLILLNGGAEGIRTPDLLIANQSLYQLSYDPIPPKVGHG